MKNLNRRVFLNTILTGAATGLASLKIAGSTPDNLSPQKADFPFFDFHSHPSKPQTLIDMNLAGMAGAFCCLVADMKIIRIENSRVRAYRQFEEGEAWKDYQVQLKMLKEFIAATPVRLSLNSKDFSYNDPKPAAYLGCEGPNYLEKKIDRLQVMYKDGIRLLQLVHYSQNEVGDLQTEIPVHNGLSSFGADVVKEMNSLGMLIDVAHASYDTALAVSKKTIKPIVLSHTILEVKGKDVKRAITPDHAKAIAGTGGVIGMWPSGFNENMEAFIDNTFRMIDVVGIDHIGLGTDMDGNYKPVIANYSELNSWSKLLLTKGLSKEDLMKLANGNAQRVIKEAIG